MRTSVLPGLGRSAGIDLGILRPAAVVYSDGAREILDFRIGTNDTSAISAAARRIARSCDAVWVERLDFSRKANARGEVLADWQRFVAELEKAGRRSGASIGAVPAEHSSRICPICEYKSGKHAVQVRIWGCIGCRTPLDRDYAAATNVLLRGEPELREILTNAQLHQLAAAEETDVVPGALYEAELFTQIRKTAYSRRRNFTDPGEWRSDVECFAAQLAATMPEPVDPVIVARMIDSITAWSWTHITPEGFSAAQAWRGRRGAAARVQSVITQSQRGGRVPAEIMAEIGRLGAAERRARLAATLPEDLSAEERTQILNRAMLGPGLTAYNEKQKVRAEDLRRRVLAALDLPYPA
ncbi:putative transposase-like DNA-binding protein [Nocardia tenerifensis]|uniref:Putative transposase-like DNA-binding protein n=1 Tax=Nocardia tenerifensis TaxID=228006 RepID=A0A318K064_9NOCA|nr:zinc ribbon domain-containing protein [Nocardia tenerifensis]PXX52290.1 putative transposase-like DNA-binding protein [Nocardia tenerifensis]